MTILLFPSTRRSITNFRPATLPEFAECLVRLLVQDELVVLSESQSVALGAVHDHDLSLAVEDVREINNRGALLVGGRILLLRRALSVRQRVTIAHFDIR